MSDLAFIGEGVVIGDEVSVGPGAVILGPCTIEDGVWIGPGAQIGAPPEIMSETQNTAWSGDLLHAGVRIGEQAVVRENSVIHQGTHRETTIGAKAWVLNSAYVAHDVLIGENSVVSTGVSIGGHCVLGDRVNIGMNAVVHQRRVIAHGAIIGMGTPITGDVPPFGKVYGTPPRLVDVNRVGLARAELQNVTEALYNAYSQGNFLNDERPLPPALEALSSVITWWRSQGVLQPVRHRIVS